MSGCFTCAALTLGSTASSVSSTKRSCDWPPSNVTVGAMRVQLNNLDSRVARIEGRVDLQREIARLAAELEA